VSITAYSRTILDHYTLVTATSDLSGTVYYHWYLDGLWVAATGVSSHAFYMETSAQSTVQCKDTNDIDFDGPANAPTEYPGRRTIFWYRSRETDVVKYRCESQKDGGSWVSFGTVAHDDTWLYSKITPILDDLATYVFRVLALDKALNDGTAKEVDSEVFVRRPDAPNWTYTYASGTTRLTYASN